MSGAGWGQDWGKLRPAGSLGGVLGKGLDPHLLNSAVSVPSASCSYPSRRREGSEPPGLCPKSGFVCRTRRSRAALGCAYAPCCKAAGNRARAELLAPVGSQVGAAVRLSAVWHELPWALLLPARQKGVVGDEADVPPSTAVWDTASASLRWSPFYLFILVIVGCLRLRLLR